MVEEADVGVIESPDLDDGENLLFGSLSARRVYELALAAELHASAFYQRAIDATQDPDLEKIYHELGGIVDEHVVWLNARLAVDGDQT